MNFQIHPLMFCIKGYALHNTPKNEHFIMHFFAVLLFNDRFATVFQNLVLFPNQPFLNI